MRCSQNSDDWMLAASRGGAARQADRGFGRREARREGIGEWKGEAPDRAAKGRGTQKRGRIVKQEREGARGAGGRDGPWIVTEPGTQSEPQAAASMLDGCRAPFGPDLSPAVGAVSEAAEMDGNSRETASPRSE